MTLLLFFALPTYVLIHTNGLVQLLLFMGVAVTSYWLATPRYRLWVLLLINFGMLALNGASLAFVSLLIFLVFAAHTASQKPDTEVEHPSSLNSVGVWVSFLYVVLTGCCVAIAAVFNDLTLVFHNEKIVSILLAASAIMLVSLSTQRNWRRDWLARLALSRTKNLHCETLPRSDLCHEWLFYAGYLFTASAST